MKNLTVLILFSVMFYACDKIPDSIVESAAPNPSINLLQIDAPDNFVYDVSDSSITISAKFEDIKDISECYFRVFSFSGAELTSENIIMSPVQNTPNTYSGEFVFSVNNANGKYIFDLFIVDMNNRKTPVAKHYVNYFNGQVNSPPQISNLIMPDEIDRGVDFVFSVDVFDPNGKEDIKLVYFNVWRPDGSQIIANPGANDSRFPMFDDGNTVGSGDTEEGDGRYSLKNSFSQTTQTGAWTFEFGAIDQNDSLSNIIKHNIEVK